MRCEEWPPLDPEKQAMLDRGARLSRVAIPIAQVGLVRLAVTSIFCRSGRVAEGLAGAAGNGGRHVLSRIKSEVGKMPAEVWPIVAAHWSRPGFYAGLRSHMAAVPDTVREMHNAEPICGIPVVLLTPATSPPLSEDCLLRIGDNVSQLIARESAHWIHLDEPQLVIDSIRQMVNAASSRPLQSLAEGCPCIVQELALPLLTPQSATPPAPSQSLPPDTRSSAASRPGSRYTIACRSAHARTG